MPFEFHTLAIPEVILVQARTFADDRGSFAETYKHSDFTSAGIPGPFVQDNLSHSGKGVLRGLHFQKPPKAQGKLVMVAAGEIYDVAVDLRVGSPTYLQWVGMTLSPHPFRLLYIPPGFAHGFCVLSETAVVAYKVTAEFAAELDSGIAWDDPDVGIRWPIADPILSPKDASLPFLRQADPGFKYP